MRLWCPGDLIIGILPTYTKRLVDGVIIIPDQAEHLASSKTAKQKNKGARYL